MISKVLDKSGASYLVYTYGGLALPRELFLFWPCSVACGILVPRPGIEPGPSAVKAQSPNHWTAREFPKYF